jgi:hypothetical protein
MPLVRLRSPSEFDRPVLPRPPTVAGAVAPSMGFCFPSTSSDRGVHSTRVYLARYVPLPGFRNLLAAYSSPTLVGLFHPTDAPGILPFRAFSSRRAVTPCRRPLPSCRCLSCHPRALGAQGRRRFSRRPRNDCEKTLRPTSGLCSRRELVRDPADVTPRGRPMLS